ncbi:MAG: hypothetical protein IH933_01870 [Euryarchaeota archaeon]|nr:hypothetical protein [Euryarchaeota archaeon]
MTDQMQLGPGERTDAAMTLCAGMLAVLLGICGIALTPTVSFPLVLVVPVVSLVLFFVGWWLVVKALVLVVRIGIDEVTHSQ